MDLSINICNVEYKVVLKSPKEMPNSYGECHNEIQEIWLSDNNNDETQRNTLLHECLHAISEMYQIELNERQVNVLSTALISFARSNPKHIDYFFKS